MLAGVLLLGVLRNALTSTTSPPRSRPSSPALLLIVSVLTPSVAASVRADRAGTGVAAGAGTDPPTPAHPPRKDATHDQRPVRRGPRRSRRSPAPWSLTAAAAAAPPGTTTRTPAAPAPAPPRPNPDAPLKEGLKIAFLPKQINNPYFTIVDKGGKEAVEEFKGEAKEVGPSDAKASSQVSYINTLTQQRTRS